jgi:secondary thiamine-phosphate synthase enzyme
VFVPHTTAAILINENDDPALQKDLDNFLKQLAPRDKDYHHNDGNCDAHLKASVIGCSKSLLIENGRLVLGRWQGVFFCEFDGPRRRDLRIKSWQTEKRIMNCEVETCAGSLAVL